MELLLSDISQLIDAVPSGEQGLDDAATVAQRLASFRPAAMLLLDREGRLAGKIDVSHAISLHEMQQAAQEIARRLVGEAECGFALDAWAGPHRVYAVRLQPETPYAVIGCAVAAAPGDAAEQWAARPRDRVLGALAWLAHHAKGVERSLQTRIAHFTAEHEMLKSSHASAIANAIEEREVRLREQREHTARLHAIMMMAADGIITVDERGVIESFNEAASRIFGYEPAEVLGRSVSLLAPAAGDGARFDYLQQLFTAARGDAPQPSREVIARRKCGALFPMDVSVSEVMVGERRLLTGICRDITERKEAEQRLRQLHMQNESILNSVSEGIVGVDAEGRAIFVNRTAAAMLGWEVEQLLGSFTHEIMHYAHADGRPLPWEESPVRATLRDGRPRHGDGHVFWRKDGSSFPVEFSCTAICDDCHIAGAMAGSHCAPICADGRVSGAVVSFRDVSEHRRLEAQLRQAQKLESIGQLAAGIAHEINTPTQYIGDNTRFLSDAFSDLAAALRALGELREALAAEGDVRQAVERAAAVIEQADIEYLLEEIPRAIAQTLDGVERVAMIVRSMKQFSHPGGQEMQAVNLNEALESTLTVSRNEWKYIADVATEFDPQLPPVVCLPGEMNQVFLNLVINAAHAIAARLGPTSAERGTIRVRTRRDGAWVEVSVADTGTGIPEAVRAKIFDPFFTTKEVGRGTGQGLAIAHSIVCEKHGGTISFETEMGVGTTFFVRIPIEPPAGRPGGDAAGSPQGGSP